MNNLDDSDVTSCDVVIVGGSIAGNYLASLIAGHGITIHVIEAHKEIGFPMECAGIVSGKITSLLAIPRDIILNRIKKAKVFSPDGSHATIRARDQPVVLDRVKLDQHFYHVAEERGVQYHLNERVISVEKHENFVMVTSTRERYVSKMIVGCDGASSIVARHHGINHSRITGKQVIARIDKAIHELMEPDTCELHFDPEWHGLFGWIIPESPDVYRIGIASPMHVARHFGTFISRSLGLHSVQATRNNGISTLNITGGTIPIGIPTRCSFDRALLVGDAACQVKASTGGGIVMLAMASKLAAEAILQAFEKNDFSGRFLFKHYERPCKMKIEPDLRVHFVIHKGIEKLDRRDFATLFNLSKSKDIQALLLNVADMDFPLKFMLQLFQKRAFIAWVSKFFWKHREFFKHVFMLLVFGKRF